MKNKEYSERWLAYINAESNFYNKKKEFFFSNYEDQISDLELALSSNRNEIISALTLLVDFEPKYTVLLNAIIEIAIDGNEIAASLAEKVILKYKDSAKNEIMSSINTFLEKNEESYFNYSGVAQLLYRLEYKSALLDFLKNYCSKSKDSNILEILDDYLPAEEKT